MGGRRTPGQIQGSQHGVWTGLAGLKTSSRRSGGTPCSPADVASLDSSLGSPGHVPRWTAGGAPRLAKYQVVLVVQRPSVFLTLSLDGRS